MEKSAFGFKKRYVLIALVLLLVIVTVGFFVFKNRISASTISLNSLKLYVSPIGNDTYSGTSLNGALKTLQGARDKIRRMKTDGQFNQPIDVLIQPGTYYLASTLEFKPEDSGTADYPITYRGDGDGVNIVGGQEIPKTWTKCTSSDPLCYGLSTGIKTNVYHINLGTGQSFNSLFVGNERATRARTPNEGSFYNVLADPAFDADYLNKDGFYFRAGDIDPDWRNFRDIETVALMRWITLRYKLDRVVSNKAFIQAPPAGYQFNNDYLGNSRYYLDNVFEGLDIPGEWYLDKPNRDLFYYPKTDQSMTTAEIVVPGVQQLVNITGTETNLVTNLGFENINFSFTDWSLPPTAGYNGSQTVAIPPGLPTISLKYTDGISFTDNTLSHLGTHAIKSDSGKNLTITRNEIYDTGCAGIQIGETENRYFFSTNNSITNNRVHDVGKIIPTAVPISGLLVANSSISNNEIYNAGYTGISLGWQFTGAPTGSHNNAVYANHIHHVGLLLNDLAGIYILGNQPNTTVSKNLVHDIHYTPQHINHHAIAGIFLENKTTNVTVRDNIVFNNDTNLFFNDTDGNLIENNMFMNGEYTQIFYQSPRELIVRNNIFAYKNLNARLSYGSFWEPNTTIDTIGSLNQNDNLFYDPNTDAKTNYKILLTSHPLIKNLSDFIRISGHDSRSKIENPLFANSSAFDIANTTDPLTRNYSLLPSSPAFTLGFHTIDLGGIGPDFSQLILTADKMSVASGGEIKYAVSYTNTKVGAISNVSFSVPIPASTQLVAGSITNGGVSASGKVSWVVSTLNPEQEFNGSFKVKVN